MSLLSNAQLQERLDKSPSDVRVTKEMIDARIKRVDYMGMFNGSEHPTMTVCTIMLDNGYSVAGTSACVDPKNYNRDVGETRAYQNAYEKLYGLFGFLLAETLYRAKINAMEGQYLPLGGEDEGL